MSATEKPLNLKREAFELGDVQCSELEIDRLIERLEVMQSAVRYAKARIGAASAMLNKVYESHANEDGAHCYCEACSAFRCLQSISTVPQGARN
jgi:hypothetical protein